MAHQLPDWEGHPPTPPTFIAKHTRFSSQPAVTKEVPPIVPSNYPRPTLRERFDRIFPPHRTYFGRNRRVFLIALSILVVCLLILILGLGLGLGLGRRGKNSPSFLPLPPATTPVTGDLTYFDTSLGACGLTTSSHDLICAVSHILYDAAATSTNPNNNRLCGRSIRVTRYDDGLGTNRSVDVVVVDRCVGCAVEDLDLSYDAFDRIAERDLGRVRGTWAWL